MTSSMDPKLFPALVVLTSLCCIILSASAQVFISIDCGSSASYRDANSIDWSGDNNYTTGGVSRSVPSSNSMSRVMDTLRVFNNGRRRNCYIINSVNQSRILLRVSFYYGNYDGRSAPPSFDLHYDGNFWVTVRTQSAVTHEVIYVMKRNSVSVCVSQIRPGEFPFISTIEVRGLETSMYNSMGTQYPLMLLRRSAYGSTSTTRFGDDPYDRIWVPSRAPTGSGLTEVSTTATFSGRTGALNRPPPAVLSNAVTTTRSNGTINLVTGFPARASVYINWYFSEVARLSPNQTRSFNIFLGNEMITNRPISPPYQNFTQGVAWDHSVTSSTTMSLVPTSASGLPPLINAMEVFQIGAPLTNGTNSDDASGLASLQRTFAVLRTYNGDPCLPRTYSWEWIVCNNDSRPRVTSLLLGSFGLSGALPDFSSMHALRTIELQNNTIQGPIPGFLATLTDLTTLNLANNQFVGSVPTSISGRTGLNLVVTGNPGLDNAAAGTNRMNKLHMVFETTIAFIVISWLLC